MDERAEKGVVVDTEGLPERQPQPVGVVAGLQQDRENPGNFAGRPDLRAYLASGEYPVGQQIAGDGPGQVLLRVLVRDKADRQFQQHIGEQAVGLDNVKSVSPEDSNLAIAGIETTDQ